MGNSSGARELRVPQSIPKDVADAQVAIVEHNSLPVIRPILSDRVAASNDSQAEVRCVVCHKRTQGLTCSRCQQPLCPSHEPQGRAWCLRCEVEFLGTHPPSTGERVAQWLMFGTAGACVLSALTAAHTPGKTASALVVTLLLACLASLVVMGSLRWRRRVHFAAVKPESAELDAR